VFRPPQKNGDNARVLTYLVKTRGIRHNILQPHITGGRIYQAYRSNNCVFTGIDYETGEVRYAFQRSSLAQSRIMYETLGSDKRYSFSIPGLSDSLFIFESVVDLFSYLSMGPGETHSDASFLSLGGLGSIPLDSFLKQWGGLREIIFCLDSDSAADDAYEQLGCKYTSRGYNVSRHRPVYKDWNLQLTRGGHSFPAPPVPWEGLS
jgi:hypothetical protein